MYLKKSKTCFISVCDNGSGGGAKRIGQNHGVKVNPELADGAAGSAGDVETGVLLTHLICHVPASTIISYLQMV